MEHFSVHSEIIIAFEGVTPNAGVALSSILHLNCVGHDKGTVSPTETTVTVGFLSNRELQTNTEFKMISSIMVENKHLGCSTDDQNCVPGSRLVEVFSCAHADVS